MIDIGQHVKLFLRNGMVLEGIIEKDTAAEVVLRSLEGESLMILHRPTEDIMMTKIMLVEAPLEETKDEEPPKPTSEFHERVTTKLNEIREAENDSDLKEKSIEELKQMALDQERQILAQKRREHFGTAGAAKLTQYSSPYTPRPHPRSNTARSAYQPGKLKSWAFGRPPRKGE